LGNRRKVVKRNSKVRLGIDWVEGERIVILDTCKFTLKTKSSLAWKMGRLRDKYYEYVTVR
jgi:hypothetical protein